MNGTRRTLLGCLVAAPALAAASVRPSAASPHGGAGTLTVLPRVGSYCHGGTNPDARLIALCDEYMHAVAAYNADGGNLELEVDPRWHAISAIEDHLDGLTAKTLEGILAKARVALFQAQLPDGREDFSDSYTGDWPEQVVRDLLRLHGGAA